MAILLFSNYLSTLNTVIKTFNDIISKRISKIIEESVLKQIFNAYKLFDCGTLTIINSLTCWYAQ